MFTWTPYDLVKIEHESRLRQAELARKSKELGRVQSLSSALRDLIARFGSF